MFLREVSLNEFRNFKALKIALKPRVCFFIGDNGQGKTNFLEAVFLLSRGSSFRPANPEVLIRSEAGEARLRGKFTRKGLEYDAELRIKDGKRTAAINSKRVSTTDLVKHFPTVLFSPESLSAIKEGPEERRKLLDELIIIQNPSLISLLREYTKCLRTRNKLLHDIRDGRANDEASLLTLESLNKIFLILATHLTFARLQALQAIKGHFSAAMNMISGIDAEIETDYLISAQSARAWSESEVFIGLQKRQIDLARREIEAGRSLVGPHKHDIRFLFAGNDSRFYCSQGQQRALILSLKIAQIVYHQQVHQTYPILLLDDVLSELDPSKRENLMGFLEGISAQVLITATDLVWPEKFGAESNSVFLVSNGQIEAAH